MLAYDEYVIIKISSIVFNCYYYSHMYYFCSARLSQSNISLTCNAVPEGLGAVCA
jgi:hypothetical protein